MLAVAEGAVLVPKRPEATVAHANDVHERIPQQASEWAGKQLRSRYPIHLQEPRVLMPHNAKPIHQFGRPPMCIHLDEARVLPLPNQFQTQFGHVQMAKLHFSFCSIAESEERTFGHGQMAKESSSTLTRSSRREVIHFFCCLF